jgi:LacI family transcriptional regulator
MKRATRSSEPVTIIDVAREAGVSYATVSRVINHEDYVKPETRERVTAALKRLGYVGNRQARTLRGGRTHTVGLLVRGLDTGYIGEIVRGIDRELVAHHYDLMLYTTHWRQQSESRYIETLTQGMVDGLLLVLPRTPENYLDRLRERHFPYVLIDHQGIDSIGPAVGATNRQGGHDATHYLLELGHRHIGFITGDMQLGCAQERLQGYKDALQEYDIALYAQWVVEGDFLQPSGYAGAVTLLARSPRPTAIVASNDVMALGVMEAVRDHGLRIPEDISIIGFDDIPQAASVHPPLTTIRQPLEEMGRVAAQLLLEMIKNDDQPNQHIALPTQLIKRHSCQAPSTVLQV